MSFTTDSEKLMKSFVDDFDKFSIKKKATVQKQTDKILKGFYKDIRSCDLYVKTLSRRLFLNNNVHGIKTPNDIPKTPLMGSGYIPDNIKLYIEETAVGYFKMSTWVNGKIKLNIYFLMFLKSDFNRLKKIEEMLEDALKIIRFCSLYIKKNSMDSLNVYLYLTKIKKELPKSQISILGTTHCNSAVTFACQEKGEILVFREEEWKKVLIHELCHSMCLDFSGLDYKSLRSDIKSLYDIKSDFEISEAYSEFWATIIHCCFCSYSLLDSKEDLETYLLFTQFCIQFEKIFSLFQCVKMLNHMGLRYTNLIDNDDVSTTFKKVLYKEETNVFPYYVLKCVLLFNSDKFLKWCMQNNPNIVNFDKNPVTLKKFGKFIKSNYDDKKMIKMIKDMEVLYLGMRGSYVKPNKGFVINTTRMTICELL